MVKIYCIEDINGNKYIGSTKNTLHKRLTDHKSEKKTKKNGTCKSKLLDLYNCKIYTIEECDEEHRNNREQYWIDNINCVNIRNQIHNAKKYHKEYYNTHKERITKARSDYNMKNKQNKKDYDLFRKKSICYGCYDFIMMLNEYI